MEFISLCLGMFKVRRGSREMQHGSKVEHKFESNPVWLKLCVAGSRRSMARGCKDYSVGRELMMRCVDPRTKGGVSMRLGVSIRGIGKTLRGQPKVGTLTIRPAIYGAS